MLVPGPRLRSPTDHRQCRRWKVVAAFRTAVAVAALGWPNSASAYTSIPPQEAPGQRGAVCLALSPSCPSKYLQKIVPQTRRGKGSLPALE
jgi:hypothetical protein